MVLVGSGVRPGCHPHPIHGACLFCLLLFTQICQSPYLGQHVGNVPRVYIMIS